MKTVLPKPVPAGDRDESPAHPAGHGPPAPDLEARRSPSLLFCVVLGVAFYAFIHAFSLLAPIILSLLLTLLISLALNPVVARLRAWSGGRTSATVLIVAGFVLVVGLTGWAFFGPMKSSVAKFSKKFPEYLERLQKPFVKMEQAAATAKQKAQAPAEENTPGDDKPSTNAPPAKPAPLAPSKESNSLGSSLGQMLMGVAGSFAAAAFNAAQILVVLVTVFFGVTFTLLEPRPVIRAFFSMVPERHHPQALVIAQRIAGFVPGWAAATLLGMATIGLLVFLLMWPLFGFADALVLGLIACIMEAVPFVGPLLSAVPAVLFGVAKGGMAPLWAVLAYMAIQALENNVIMPLIMARGMKLHPVAVIFSMLLCVATFGVLGVIVAAPLVAIIGILHDELYRKRFLPTTTEANMDRLAQKALREKVI